MISKKTKQYLLDLVENDIRITISHLNLYEDESASQDSINILKQAIKEKKEQLEKVQFIEIE